MTRVFISNELGRYSLFSKRGCPLFPALTPLISLCFLYYLSHVPSLNVTSQIKTAFPKSMKGETLKVHNR